MLKPLCISLVILFSCQVVMAQKNYINRKVAQKNYEGYMLMTEHKYDSALTHFNQAIKDDPEAFFIYQNRAICKLHLKDTLGAISDYKTNIKLEPDNTDSKYALGNIYKHQKDSVKALQYFIPAIQQANDEFSQKKLLYMNNFAGHYYRLHAKYDSALTYYRHVKAYTPMNASVYINSAVCHFQLDSLSKFCADLEQAFVLGGNVNCIALKSYCDGCTHLLDERGRTDTLSTALDTRLAGIIPDTIFYHAFQTNRTDLPQLENSKKDTVYYNDIWQICLPDKASYYRVAFWAKHRNFYGGDFSDYYINGEVYAKGRIESSQIKGTYKSYHKNGNIKLDAHFANSKPTEKWIFYLEDGTPDLEIDFFLDEFTLRFLNENSTNFASNSGTGKFKIVLDQWDKLDFTFSGEYENKEREGQWVYTQAGKKIIFETYKKGKFRRGYVSCAIGNLTSLSSKIDATIFIPPQITQVSNLFFDSYEAVDYYPFIKVSGF